ncbi:MAG: FCD domain-containing protein [Sporichthyaceae bacterium]|nr:FCD domain-containing protein [Sporichthyaceae bacterium]
MLSRGHETKAVPAEQGSSAKEPGPAEEPAPSDDADPPGVSVPAGASVAMTDSVLRPVRSGNAFEETVERLLSIIKLGVYGHGERLPAERELATRLRVSRVTLREAIRTLQQAGYVDVRRGRSGGSYVTYRPKKPGKLRLRRIAKDMGRDLADTLTYRRVLEAGAAATLAERGLTAEQRSYLTERLHEVENASQDAYRRTDTLLHLALGELTGSPTLAAAIADTRGRLNDLLNAIPMIESNLRHAHEQHRAIIDAILAGDPEAARRAVEEHLDGTAALLRGFLA